MFALRRRRAIHQHFTGRSKDDARQRDIFDAGLYWLVMGAHVCRMRDLRGGFGAMHFASPLELSWRGTVDGPQTLIEHVSTESGSPDQPLGSGCHVGRFIVPAALAKAAAGCSTDGGPCPGAIGTQLISIPVVSGRTHRRFCKSTAQGACAAVEVRHYHWHS